MSDLLSGLDALGLGDLKDMQLYEKPEEKGAGEGAAAKQEKVQQEQDFLFDKTYTCPICGKTFKSHTVKAGKVKMNGTDTDLRPRYDQLDMIKYEVVACPHCGYAALLRYFQYLIATQKKAIIEKICASYKPRSDETEFYTYEAALERFKLALVNAIVKGAKSSEKAYICLKTAWLLRGQAESLDPKTPGYQEKVTAIHAQEKDFLKNALEGFMTARQTEEYPMCGMDEATIDYLIAAIAMGFEQYEVTSRLLSSILTSSAANPRMKDKARDLRDTVLKKIRESN